MGFNDRIGKKYTFSRILILESVFLHDDYKINQPVSFVRAAWGQCPYSTDLRRSIFDLS